MEEIRRMDLKIATVIKGKVPEWRALFCWEEAANVGSDVGFERWWLGWHQTTVTRLAKLKESIWMAWA